MNIGLKRKLIFSVGTSQCSISAILILINLILAANSNVFAQEAGQETPNPLYGNQVIANPQILNLSLSQAVAVAKQRSFNVKRNELFTESAQLRVETARTGTYPTLDSGLSVFENKGKFGADLSPITQFDSRVGVVVNQPVDIGGTIKRQVNLAEADLSTAALGLEKAEQDEAFNVQSNYFNALRSQEQARIDNEIAAQLEALLNRAKQKAPSAVNTLLVELQNARQVANSSQTAADLSYENLKQILRIPFTTQLHLTEPLVYKPVNTNFIKMINEATTFRPDILQAKARVEQNKLFVESVYDARKPSMNLNATVGKDFIGTSPGEGFRNSFRDWNASVNINIPFAYFDWGNLSRNRAQAVINQKQAENDLLELQERAALDVRQAIVELVRAEQRVKTLPDVKLARRTLADTEQRFLAGGVTVAVITNARNNLRQAELAAVQAKADYNQALARLQKATGTTLIK